MRLIFSTYLKIYNIFLKSLDTLFVILKNLKYQNSLELANRPHYLLRLLTHACVVGVEVLGNTRLIRTLMCRVCDE